MAKHQPQHGYTIQRVSCEELRRRFNDGGYWEKAKAGLLRQVVLEENFSTLLPNEAGPIRSQMVSYRDENGQEIARVHRFLRPDGTIAASGRPDPKRLYENGILYRINKTPHP
jgi:hypothetical protein